MHTASQMRANRAIPRQEPHYTRHSRSSAYLDYAPNQLARPSVSSFKQDEVAVLCAWPDLFICDECVGLMVNIIAEKNKEWRDRQIEALTKLNMA